MTGTAASLGSIAASVSLPAPVVRVGKNFGGVAYQVSDSMPGTGSATGVTAVNIATVSVYDLPQAILDDIATYQPKLELMRYVSVRSSKSSYARNFRNAGYVHPAHGPAPSGNGSRTRGGDQLSVTSAIRAIRPTEWDVTGWGQVIDVTQGMHGFMNIEKTEYRRPSTGAEDIGGVDTLVSSGRRTSGKGFGRRFPYETKFRPGYYKFRWSIIDPSDTRKQRISGPLSDTVSLSNEVFPFAPAEAWLDTVGNDYHATAVVDPRFDHRVTRIWVGSVSRLPR